MSSAGLKHRYQTQQQVRARLVMWTVATGAVLLFIYVNSVWTSKWIGGPELQTLIATAGTLIAFIAGILAFMRYHTRPSVRFLFIGMALIGAAFLDAGHVLISSNYFTPYLVSDLNDLVPWSWATSRIYFVTLILVGLVMEGRSHKVTREQIHRQKHIVIAGAVAFFLVCAAVFLTVELPRGYFPELTVHRPQEIIIGFAFLVAFIFTVRWTDKSVDPFDDWFMISLVLAMFTHFLFMPFSDRLFDATFHVAHLIKVASYAAILLGLLASTLGVLQKERENATFITSMSNDLERHIRLAYHDLREPLRGILNLADWIDEDSGDKLSPESRDNLAMLRARVKRMDDLVIGFRDYAEAAQPKSTAELISSEKAIWTAFTKVDRHEAFDLNIAPSTPLVLSREDGLPEVAFCILENAIKHHDRLAGHISVSVMPYDGGHEFRFTDDGPGIPEIDRATVFEAFKTLKPKDQREGAGVGLAIARKIVNSIGGEIGLSAPDNGVGRGTTVWVRWPHAPRDMTGGEEVWAEPRNLTIKSTTKRQAA